MAGSDQGPSGLVVVDKPAGMTSHDVVSRVRRLVGTRKVGHAGTLDPMATGVLVLGVNRATRLLGHLSLHDKTYEATIRLGQSTVTDDAEGEVVSNLGARGLAETAVVRGMAALTGGILQRPSAVSAIKVDGERAYARVRAGEQVQLAARPVHVERFELLARRDLVVDGVALVDLDVVVDCSTGTYVRAIARDLGEALGTGGHLTALRRTRVGGFDLARAQRLPGWDEQDATIDVIGLADAVTTCFPWVRVDEEQARAVAFGRPLADLPLPGEPTALLGPDGTFLALYRPTPDGACPVAVFVAG